MATSCWAGSDSYESESNYSHFTVNSLLLRFTDDTFDPDQAATIGE